jgi:hypothetical protein
MTTRELYSDHVDGPIDAKASADPQQQKISSPPNSRGAEICATAGREIKRLSVYLDGTSGAPA